MDLCFTRLKYINFYVVVKLIDLYVDDIENLSSDRNKYRYFYYFMMNIKNQPKLHFKTLSHRLQKTFRTRRLRYYNSTQFCLFSSTFQSFNRHLLLTHKFDKLNYFKFIILLVEKKEGLIHRPK